MKKTELKTEHDTADLDRITFEVRGLFQDAIEAYEKRGFSGIDLLKMSYGHIKHEINALVRAYLGDE